MVSRLPRPRPATVVLDGELTAHAVSELVATVEAVVAERRCSEVELVVRSDGGEIEALDAYLRALERWLERGLSLHTRVEERVASAAALVLAMGVERSAAPGAQVHFHNVLVERPLRLDARAAATLHTVLHDADTALAELLTDRALGAARAQARVPGTALVSDLTVLEYLVDDAGASPRRGPPERRARRLAHALERRVHRATRTRDRDALVALYLRLFEADQPVSALLARTLRVVDTVSDARAHAACRAPTRRAERDTHTT